MTERELKRLSRVELLEVIVMQSDELEAVKKQSEALQTENEELKKKLDDREIAIRESGNLAEASLAVTKIFAEAEKAAAIYKENVARQQGGEGAYAQMQTPMDTEATVRAAQQRADGIIEEAKQKARQLLIQAEAYSQRTRQQADAYWNETKQKLEKFLSERAGLVDLLGQGERRNDG